MCLALHGFPEFWYAWRHQIPALAGAGFRAVAPDLRGYNLSDKPAGVAAYSLEALSGDVAGLFDGARKRGLACLIVILAFSLCPVRMKAAGPDPCLRLSA